MSPSGPASRLVVSAILTAVLLAGCAPAATLPPTARSTSGAPASAPAPAGTGVPATEVADVAGSFVRIGAMTTMRAAHSATLLPDGLILIAGGCTEHSCEGTTASTELLDPETGTSQPGPDMLEPRVGHAAVALPDGRVILIGGFGASAVTRTTEIYDPATGDFTPGPDLTEPRADPVAFLLADGSVLIAGGYGGSVSLATAELLDPDTMTFTPTGSMTTPRSRNTGVLLADGRVLVIGGSALNEGEVLASTELYDPATGTWSTTGDMTVRRHKLGAVTLDDGRVLVVGGSDESDGFGRYRSGEVYDPATGTWTATGDMAAVRYKHQFAVVRLLDGRVLVAGGAPTAELYNAETGTFETVPGSFSVDQSFSVAVRLADGSVVVIGGYDQDILLTDQVLRFVP